MQDEEEAERVKAERIAAYSAKKSKKPALVAKSSLLIDVKPWDDETDMKKMEELVRSIQMDGLLWGASKLAPVGYGIKKLVMNAVIEDDKVSTDDLEEKIVAFEDYVSHQLHDYCIFRLILLFVEHRYRVWILLHSTRFNSGYLIVASCSPVSLS